LEHYENDCCTPGKAVIIGYAGVDGVHYHAIPKFGEKAFAVRPMNFGDRVHPDTKNLEGLTNIREVSTWQENRPRRIRISISVHGKRWI